MAQTANSLAGSRDFTFVVPEGPQSQAPPAHVACAEEASVMLKGRKAQSFTAEVAKGSRRFAKYFNAFASAAHPLRPPR